MIVALKVHTGAGTLYIGLGDPTFEDKQYKTNAYYSNDS